MKINLVFVLILFLLATSSCSSKRFGNIPKVKAQPKKEQTAKRKSAKKQISLSAKPIIPVVTAEQTIDSPNIIKPKSIIIKRQKKNPATAIKAVVSAPKDRVKIINNTKENRVQNSSSLFENFWYSGLGEFILYIGFFIVLGLIYLFVEWLISIGLVWLVFLLALALIIYLLYLVGEFIDGVLDFFFRR